MIISPLSDVMLCSLYTQEAVSAATDEERLVKIHNVIQQLPPPHYRSSLKLSVAPWWTEVEVYDIRRRCADQHTVSQTVNAVMLILVL